MSEGAAPNSVNYADTLPLAVSSTQNRRSYYPQNGQNFTDTGSNIIRIDVNADGLLDTQQSLGTNFNTILLNKYKDREDCIGFHRDRETRWAPGSGFATLSFGAERDFQVKHEASGETKTYVHKNGEVIYLPCPMNQENFHSVPKRKKVKDCRISLTFREII